MGDKVQHSSTQSDTDSSNEPRKLDFIRQIVADAHQAGSDIVTRFPPEPNGYLHIGHAKSILLNFGIAAEFNGTCRLRFDDTNPSKEDQEFVDSIIADVCWLTQRNPADLEVRFASDYFDQMYDWAELLIQHGLTYVDDQDGETIRRNRGTVTSPGVNSPYRDRSPAENLDLFRQMRDGAFANGDKVLRAKIDMAHDNMLMRDPLMYRIQHAHHHRTADRWCIYPLYDWAHGLEDSIEGVTHSICTLEFETHRVLYDWFLDQLSTITADLHRPHQYEFNRLNVTYTVMSKRKLMELVERDFVAGWDDPRMPTICGLRRRGVSPGAIASFIAEVGVTKIDSTNEWQLLEHHIRQDLNRTAPRAMAVLDPVKLVISNWDAARQWSASVPINPENPAAGERQLPFARELWIERADFMIDPPKKFFRLGPDREVRLRGVGFVRCTSYETDDSGEVSVIFATLDETTLGGQAPADGRKVKGTLHWIAADHAVPATVRLYDHLFTQPAPTKVAEGVDWTSQLNPSSLTAVTAQVPPWLIAEAAGSRVQFERLGYFVLDSDHRPESPVINRTATLRDPFANSNKNKPGGKTGKTAQGGQNGKSGRSGRSEKRGKGTTS